MTKLVGDVCSNNFFDDVLSDGFGNLISGAFDCLSIRGREPSGAANILVKFRCRSSKDLVKWLVSKMQMVKV